MPDLTSINAFTGTTLTVAALLSLVVGWIRWVRPRYRNGKRTFTAVVDTLVGREAIVDPITQRELAPAIKGVGARMEATEQEQKEQSRQLAVMAQAVAKIAESHVQLDQHEQRIRALEEAAVERVASRAESIAAWRAMEAATLATPDVVVDPQPDGD